MTSLRIANNRAIEKNEDKNVLILVAPTAHGASKDLVYCSVKNDIHKTSLLLQYSSFSHDFFFKNHLLFTGNVPMAMKTFSNKMQRFYFIFKF